MGSPAPRFSPMPAGMATARAELLLRSHSAVRTDALAALALRAITPDTPRLSAACSRGSRLLVLRFDTGFLGIAIHNTPLGAAHFMRALPPFSPAGERAEMMRLIEHHEAHVSVKLTLCQPAGGPVPLQLLRALRALAPGLAPGGLLWRPTGRLHTGKRLERILAGRRAAALLVAPRLTSIGPRHLPAIRLVGAQAVLGHRVHLHLLDIDFARAARAGEAFLHAALQDPGLRARQSFTHRGQSFRIAHDGGSRDVTLIPVAQVSPLSRAA